MDPQSYVESRLFGLFEPEFVPSGRVEFRLDDRPENTLDPESMPATRIHDARRLQVAAARQSGHSEGGFFAEHGFVLLPHESAVEDWDVETETPESETAVSRVYGPEVEALVRTRLLPGRRIDVWQGAPMRRGPGTRNPEYAAGVHQDFGLTPDDYQESLEIFTSPEVGRVWRDRYEQDEVEGFLTIDFWRPVGMRGPLRHMPLAFCHPDSVRVEDVVPIGLLEFTPTGRPTNQSGLRYDPDQRWYYYPEMTVDEVLAFKQFEISKDEATPRMATCFHSAFELPDSRDDVERRQSSEQRVLVFLLRD